MSPAVLSLTVCFLSLVYGIYQSGHFIYKGRVPHTNIQSVIKDILVPNDVNDLIYCGIQCIREPKCLAIEMCPREDRQLCRLCNSTNPSLSAENETDSCRHLQLDYQRNNTDACSKTSLFHTCKDILNNSKSKMVSSGVYSINIDCKPTDVWCDMETDGGGWTVIQRRQSGVTDFFRSWNEYKTGFGNVSHEYWIGNDALHILTTTRNVTLRVDLEQFDGTKGYGTWNTFRVDNETEKYRHSLSGFNGTSEINDCFSHNKGSPFSTKDRDNDGWDDLNCAISRHSGWWFWNCLGVNLNGRYYTSATRMVTSVSCNSWTGDISTALKTTRMMIR